VALWTLGVLTILLLAAAFAARLRDTVELDSVRDDLAGVVHQALEPTHVSVWLRDRR
jgi:hypothetical protein